MGLFDGGWGGGGILRRWVSTRKGGGDGSLGFVDGGGKALFE